MLELVSSQPELKTTAPKRKAPWAILMAVLVDRTMEIVGQLEQFKAKDDNQLANLLGIHQQLSNHWQAYVTLLTKISEGPIPVPNEIKDASAKAILANLHKLETFIHRAWIEAFRDLDLKDAAGLLTKHDVEMTFIIQAFAKNFVNE